ncbi:MAG TPA: haloacid dehalogenase type II [Afifellaceae bacterium]|nr:haloacid dehalogenase type II [Afifellaceae bacterium]
MAAADIKVLFFDVFGTVVDWRTGVVRQLEEFGRTKGYEADWAEFADAWRAHYHPAMRAVRKGERGWANLDELHRETLIEVLPRYGIESLSDAEIESLVRVWHRLDAWPDSVPGLTRLKRRFVLSTLSNGTVALLVSMARHAGLPWDAVLCSETARAYKPDPRAYLENAAFLQVAPAEAMLVAAHNYDLRAAQRLGFRTAFVARPTEYGPGQTRDLEPEGERDFVAGSMEELADRLGC